MDFILCPGSVEVARPTAHGSSKDIQKIKPTFREDPHSELGYTFVYLEPIWRGRVPAEVVWDNTTGKYTRRYKNGRVIDWTDEQAVENLCQKRVNLKIRGMGFSMDWDTIDSFCRECPEVEVTTVDGNEYWPLAEADLMTIVTRDSCQCAEFTFMRATGIDKQSRNCRHIKLLMSGNKTLACDICCTSENTTDPATSPHVEFFQYCEQMNCDNLICSTCYESIKTKFATCPYCRKSI